MSKLGSTTIEVSNICLGGNVFGWTINEKQSFEILDAFVDEGFNFIDTADVYSRWASGVGGESETIIGKWMKQKGNRRNIVLATKVGMDMGQGKTDVTKKYILKAVEASLKRLQTDYIDLYQTHKDDESVPVEEALEAYEKLIKEGKVRTVGASNFSPDRLTAALNASKNQGFPKYEVLQPLYNLCDRAVFEKELQHICSQNNVSVIPYYSLAAGFLTGKYRTENDLRKSVRGAKAKTYFNERGFNILNALDQLSDKYRFARAAISLAWLMQQKTITAPIVSATSLEQLKTIISAARVNLLLGDIKILNDISKQ